MKLSHLIASVGLVSLLSACGGGGGGGGDEFFGAATLQIEATPDQIDTGDRTLVRTDIQDVHENGIILKYRYPEGLVYVSDTAFLEIDGQEFDISPSVQAQDGNHMFLVFFLAQELFGEDKSGTVLLQLEGSSSVINGEVEVDADVDDPLIDNAAEFDVSSPEFEAEDSASVEVKN